MSAAKMIIAAGLVVISAMTVAPSTASTFEAWKVSDVPWGDTLNVRKYPANYSQKQSAYPNGTVLQMTGRCTGGVDLRDIGHMPEWKQRRTVRIRWCEVWHDPAQNGDYVTGWVYGRYIAPY